MSVEAQSEAKDYVEVLKERRSVRGFLPKEIPADVLTKVFQTAQLSPSNCNTQPWNVYVASGEKCDQIRKKMVETAMEMKPMEPAFGMIPDFKEEYRDRQVECAYALYNTMGIERGDKMGRSMAMLRNFEFFDAPHVAFIGMPKSFGIINGVDVGMYLQTLLLSMQYHGIASCAQGALSYYPEVVKEAFDISDDIGILVGISFGYEDESVVANKTRTTRDNLENVATFI